MAFVGVVDSNISNLTSVLNAMTALGITAESTSDPDSLRRYSHLILPGVGSFRAGMESLQASGLDQALRAAAKVGTPLLGLCLGMQLLAEVGAEFGPLPGLQLVPGSVDLLTPSSPQFHLPHIGWNEVSLVGDSRLFRAMPDPSPSFYFIHSYGFSDPQSAAVSALTDHGGPVVAAIEKDNVFGVQFHPEKSQRCGLALLKNFVTLC
ncbi:imidazole glycerol phosphate synthase subunit HisH [Tardiphaga sp. vice278]|uniref:imidazole glycerol phosphate synthase subunit HisH n=1 Tax=Tardiphaga sp. vice278 TaxID=2592815 RepID=UPI001163A50F|nr:imidazole glycerol phosphate synthase subunit HisH [Tardiphaga sp. vice278]QDM17967.1 imidazole glycerol phosphate synthase subunit HisH [Tardiphaga sp. vice278]